MNHSSHSSICLGHESQITHCHDFPESDGINQWLVVLFLLVNTVVTYPGLLEVLSMLSVSLIFCGKPKAERTRDPGLPEYYSTWWGVPAPNLHVACWPFTCGVSLDVYRLSSEAQASEFYCLVVWNIFYFPYIATDFHIFQRGRYTTNQSRFLLNFSSFTLQATSHESSPF